ncbi:Amiloride-sensitive sodium channel [Nesidiocoris tenuis]|uniref:Amiloride-sensitive sodium channel n=1 Tax=Nesidiocoris tenuis TaxID=355587 RepID=A0ABN7AZB7_9HEMI|nr:Amiloride-sensitive sodium channel [Nesidiocoris tenuis]
MGKTADYLGKTAAIIRNFLGQTSLHGFRFIAEEERHWSERWFWTMLCAVSWVGFGVMFQKSYTAFQENSISFVVETTDLNLLTTLPSISICEYDNEAHLSKKAKQIFGTRHDINLDEVLRELTYFSGSAYYLKEVCNNGGIKCPRGNYSQLVRSVRAKCEEFLVACTTLESKFDCCKHFVPTETEVGPCFTFSAGNEKKLKDQGERDWIDLVPDLRSKLPAIGVGLNGTAKVYLHSEHEVPYLNTLSSEVTLTEVHVFKDLMVSTIEIENDPDLRELSIYQRKCRFPDENNLELADFYSYSSCIVDCRRRAQMKLCNCTSHFMPKTKPEEHCNYEGIICLDKHINYLSEPTTNPRGKGGLVCDCLPACVDLDFNVVDIRMSDILLYPIPNIPESAVQVRLRDIPTEKYKRIVVRGKLDMVVSIGGAAGLFLGASLLTMVELTNFLFGAGPSGQDDETNLTPNDEVRGSQNENDPPAQGVLPFVL